MEKPILSSDFSMEDLWKLREYNSLRHFDMVAEELKEDIRSGARKVQQRIEQLHKESVVPV